MQSTSLFSARDIAALERSAVAAGLNPQRTVPMVIGTKVVLMLAGPVVAFVAMTAAGYVSIPRLVVTLLAVVFGMFGPNWTWSASASRDWQPYGADCPTHSI